MSISHQPKSILPYFSCNSQSSIRFLTSSIIQQNISNCNSTFQMAESLPVITKLDPNKRMHNRTGEGSPGGVTPIKTELSFTQKYRLNEYRTNIEPNKEIKFSLSKTAIPIPLNNHKPPQNNFHNTFNRNFYNTKYVYNANKSNIYQSKEKEDNELFQMSQTHMDNQLSPVPVKYIKKKNSNDKKAIELNYKAVKDGFRNQMNQRSIKDCSNSNTTTAQETPVVTKSIKKSYHYIIGKQSARSKAGRDYNGASKVNQDSYIMKEFKMNGSIVHLIGVFDGHGINGHKISRNIKGFFNTFDPSANILSSSTNSTQSKSLLDQTNKWSSEHLKCLNHSQLFNDKSYAFFYKTFNYLTHYITLNKRVDSKLSGSTCIILLYSNNKIICANCGDSRAILIQENGKVIQLSRDHKPNLPDEKYRIESQEGRVDKISSYYQDGPYRVWLKNENYPGLAMSRSIGDSIAHSIGVSSEPEIKEYDLNEIKPKIMVTASDGIWEFLSNDQVSIIVLPYYSKGDCEGASKKLAEEAKKMWENEAMNVIDDITVVVSFFH